MEHYFIIFVIYLIRWQLSTPILSITMTIMKKGFDLHCFVTKNFWKELLNYSKYAAVANIIGGIIFFAPDCILLHH